MLKQIKKYYKQEKYKVEKDIQGIKDTVHNERFAFSEKNKMIQERRANRLKEEKEYYKKKNMGFENIRKGAEPSLVGGSLYSKFKKRGAL